MPVKQIEQSLEDGILNPEPRSKKVGLGTIERFKHKSVKAA